MTARRFLATAGGLGLAPRAPGTVASAATCVAALPLLRRGGLFPVIAALVASGVGLAALRRFEGIEHDPGEVVIDEVAGQLVALLPLAGTGARWPAIATAFALFRVLDIVKPGPVGWADRRAGSFGVMGDDLIAGGLAATLLGGAMVARRRFARPGPEAAVRRSDQDAAVRRSDQDASVRR